MLAEKARYTESFDRSELTAAPLRHLAILASMDARGDAGPWPRLRCLDRSPAGADLSATERRQVAGPPAVARVGRTRRWPGGTPRFVRPRSRITNCFASVA